MVSQSDVVPCSPPPPVPEVSLIFQFQMRAEKKILLKMCCFSFPTCFFLFPHYA